MGRMHELHPGVGHSALCLLASEIAVDQVVERCDALMLQEVAQVHVVANTEITVVLLLDSTYVRIVALVTKQPVLVAAPFSAHAGCIFCHENHLLSMVDKIP